MRRAGAYLAAVLVTSAAVLFGLSAPAQAANPIVSRFSADPSMLVANNRVYIYATDDADNGGRHFNYDFTLARNEGTAKFAADATFRQVAGLTDSWAVSFQSSNFPDRYIRHFNYLHSLDPISTATDRADATFRITG